MIYLLGPGVRKDTRKCRLSIMLGDERVGIIVYHRVLKNCSGRVFKELAILSNAEQLVNAIPDELEINYFWLSQLIVFKKYQRQGIGKQAFEEFLLRLPDYSVLAGVIHPVLNVRRRDLINFYQSVGCHIVPFRRLKLLLNFVKNK